MRISEDSSDTIMVEAFGPSGEWTEATTNIRFEDIRVMMSSKNYDWLTNELGGNLMPGQVLQLYTTALQRARRVSQGLRLRLHFLSLGLASLGWEAARVNDRLIAMDPQQTIVRTVDMLEPANPLAVEKPPYRILVVSELVPQSRSDDENQLSPIDNLVGGLARQGLQQTRGNRSMPTANFVTLGYTGIGSDG